MTRALRFAAFAALTTLCLSLAGVTALEAWFLRSWAKAPWITVALATLGIGAVIAVRETLPQCVCGRRQWVRRNWCPDPECGAWVGSASVAERWVL